jgi:hypothetical protein
VVTQCYSFPSFGTGGDDMTHRNPRILTSKLAAAFTCMLAASLLFLIPAGPAHSAAGTLPLLTPIPSGTGSHGYPYDAVPVTPSYPGAPTIDLSAYGYTEREFTMAGTASVYRQAGFWGPDGRWGVLVAQSNVPYTTRLLVRYPANPANFNGTVVVEWLNDTTGGDQDPVWSEIYQEALSQGYAYVGVSAQTGSMTELKAWDPARYGALGDSGDGQSYDIFTQAAQAVRAESATLLGGLNPATVVGTGDSQSAFRVDTYVNAIQPVSHAFDGFMAIGRSVFAAPIGSGLVAYTPVPAFVRADNTSPFIQINTEGDIEELGAALVRQPDNNYLRTWELAGAAHIDLHEGLYEAATIERENPQLTAPPCVFGVVSNGATLPDSMGVYQAEDAALTALQRWITQGVQPPHGHQIATTPFFNIVERDRFANALGGIRMPDIMVPADTYTAINFSQPTQQSLNPVQLLSTLENIFTTLSTGVITDPGLRNEGLCLLEGYYSPFSHATLRALYPTHSDYVSAYTAAAASDLASGFLTQSDYGTAVAAAQAAAVPLSRAQVCAAIVAAPPRSNLQKSQ